MPEAPPRPDTPDSSTASFATARTSHTVEWRLSSPDLSFAPVPVRLWRSRRVSPRRRDDSPSPSPSPPLPPPLPPLPGVTLQQTGIKNVPTGDTSVQNHSTPPPPSTPRPTRPPLRASQHRISTPTRPLPSLPSNNSTFIEMDTKPAYNGDQQPQAQEHDNRPTPSPAQRGAIGNSAHSPPPCPSPSVDEWSTTTELTESSLARPNPITDIWLYVLAFFIPPLAVALRIGCGFEVFLDIILWILCWIPGVIYAFYIIASRPGHL